MQTKKTATLERAQVASEAAAQAALRRGPTGELAPDEERVMRMRLGASPPRSAPLERALERGRSRTSAADGAREPEHYTDLEIELLAAEIEAHLRWKEHQAEVAARAAPRRPDGAAGRAGQPVPQHSRMKEKIVRALRKKV